MVLAIDFYFGNIKDSNFSLLPLILHIVIQLKLNRKNITRTTLTNGYKP